MPTSRSRGDYAFDRPGKYLIRVQGFLDETWSERVAGMSITVNSQGSQGQVTKMVGHLRDQAELAGVLNTLYELHLTLLSVELLTVERPRE